MRIKKDIPIIDESQDLFSRKPLADVIVRAIREYSLGRSSCITIGIYGPWGEGKTSVMNLVYSRLSQLKYKDKLTLVKYDPWLIKDQESLLIDFFKTIIGAGPSRKLNTFLKRYANLISYLAGQASEKIAPLSGNTISALFGRIINGLPGSEQSVEECKRRISFQLKREERHLIVFIDDLDRLDAKEIHTVFRLIKQVADFDNVIYLVAIDVQRVSDVLEKDNDYGKNFIDKIIQIPITLPKFQRADLLRVIKDSLYEIVKEFGIEKDKLDVEHVSAILINLIRNQRDVIRLYNALLLLMPSVKDELNLNDFCILEFLNIYDHKIYDAIYAERVSLLRLHTGDLYLLQGSDKIDKAVEERFDKSINRIIGIRSDGNKEVGEIIKYLFPKNKTRVSFRTAYEVSRICNPEYFERYFIRNYQIGSIPHSEVAKLITTLEDSNEEDISSTINRWLEISDPVRTFEALDSVIKGNDNLVTERVNRIIVIISAIFSSNLEQKLNLNPSYNIELTSSVVAWMQMYMYEIDNDGNRIILEEDINKAISKIFEKGELELCLSFLTSFYRSFDYIIKPDVFDILRFRIIPDSERSFDNILTFKRLYVQYFFMYWYNTNSKEMDDTMKSWIDNKDFNTETFIRLFIDSNKHFLQDLELFVSLFENEVEAFMKNLEGRISPNDNDLFIRQIFSNWKVTLSNYRLSKNQ